MVGPGITFDPARMLRLFFRVNRDAQRVFTFLDTAGDPFPLDGYTVTARIKRGNAVIYEKELPFVDNVITWAVTADDTKLRAEVYYWEMDFAIGGQVETWLTGQCIFHERIFDGLDTISETLTIDLTGDKVNIVVSTGGGVGGVYSGATPANQTVGGIEPGYDPTGKTSLELWEAALVKYLVPSFSAFSIQGQANTVERGTVLAAAQVFLWATTNPGNIQPDQVGAYDINNDALVFGPVANDGSEATNIIPVNFNAVPYVQQYLISSLDTQNNPFQRLLAISAAFKIFYGVPVAAPVNSADVRALAGNTFGNSFSIIIPQGETVIAFAYPDTRPDITDAAVKYVEGFNAPVGNTFTKVEFPVNDAAAVPAGYKIYTSILGGPYPADATYNVILP